MATSRALVEPAEELGGRIGKLGVLLHETQGLARTLRSSLAAFERELVLSAAEAERHSPPSGTGAPLCPWPHALSDRIRRVEMIGANVNGLLRELVEELRRALEAHWSVLATSGPLAKDLKAQVEDFERRLVASALEASGGNQKLAATALGILPSTLSEKMKRLGLRADGRRSPAPSRAP